MGTNAEKIQLANITIDSKFQTRGQNDEETVAAYAELITAEENPNSWPFAEPVRITIVGGYYYLTDGFHRYAAAKRVGRRYVLASVKVGTYLEAFQDALGANASHGRQRTNQEKNNIVVVALSEPEISKLSNRAIAKICHVSELLVRKHRPAKSKPQVRFNRSQSGGGNSKSPSDFLESLAKKEALEPGDLAGLKLPGLKALAKLRGVELAVTKKAEIVKALLGELLPEPKDSKTSADPTHKKKPEEPPKPVNYQAILDRVEPAGFSGEVCVTLPIVFDKNYSRRNEQINLRQLDPGERFAFQAVKKGLENSEDRPKVVTATSVLRYLLKTLAAGILAELEENETGD